MYVDEEGKSLFSLIPKAVNLISKGAKWVYRFFTVKTKIPSNSIEHIFSKKHIKDGILQLGKNKDDILKTTEKIIDKNIDKLKEGSNTIEVVMNGHKATIRVYVKNGEILSVDLFKGVSSRKIGNYIK